MSPSASSRSLVCVLLVRLALGEREAAAALDGELVGTVRDATGAPVAGARITVTSPRLLGEREGVATIDGRYRISRLPPGSPYTLRFSHSGFTDVEVASLSVAIDRETRVDAVLSVRRLDVPVEVVSPVPVLDASRTATSQTFSSTYLRDVVIGPGRVSLFLFNQAAGTNGGLFDPNVLGGNAIENSYLIDGVNTTDPKTHKFSFQPNYDAMEEVGFQTSSYDAEFGRATGGVVNLVTRSGGNDLRGTLDVRYDSQNLAENGDHFDRSDADFTDFVGGVTLGGALVKDRLWLFGSFGRTVGTYTPITTTDVVAEQNPTPPTLTLTREWDTSGKLTFRAARGLEGFAAVFDSVLQQSPPDNPNTGITRPEAAGIVHHRSRLYDLRLTGVPSPAWLVDLQLGRLETHDQVGPVSEDLVTSNWVNRRKGNVQYDNYARYSYNDQARNFAALAGTFLADRLAGSHAWKAGLELGRTPSYEQAFATGTPSSAGFCPAGLVCGATFTFNDLDAYGARIPNSQTVSERSPAASRDDHSFSAYLQDQWKPLPRVTVNAGIRYDRDAFYNNVGLEALVLEKIVPRLGLAVDVLGDATTIFRAHWGRYLLDPAHSLGTFLDTNVTSPVVRFYTWNTTSQSWQPGTPAQTGGVFHTVPLVDAPLRPTYDEQVVVGAERALWRGASLSASWVSKSTSDIFQATCTNQSNCVDLWLSNQPGRELGLSDVLKKSYDGLLVELWCSFPRGVLNASWTRSFSRGSIDSSPTGTFDSYSSDAFRYYPVNFVNRDGFLLDDARNRIKVSGSYRVPSAEIGLSAAYSYKSPSPYIVFHPVGSGTTYYDETPGTSRLPVVHQLFLQAEKTFPFSSSGAAVTVLVDVLSAFNAEQVTAIDGNSTSPSTFRQPTKYQQTRRYQLGLRLTF